MEDAAQLLEQLHDIELPGAGGLPLAPGWIALLLLLCAIILLFLRWQRRRAQIAVSSDWRAPALHELARIESRLQQGQTQKILADCSRLARRISIARDQRVEVAGLTGQQWLEKLDQLAGGDFFTRGDGQLLAFAPYQKNATADGKILQQIVDALRTLVDSRNEVTE